MQILQRLREIYASADFATSFLEAAIRKANIQMPLEGPSRNTRVDSSQQLPLLFNERSAQFDALTPPPDAYASKILSMSHLAPGEANMFSALTPPLSSASNKSLSLGGASVSPQDLTNLGNMVETPKNDFDALINFDAGADLFAAEDGLGVDLDMDWMAGLPGDYGTIGGMDIGGAITGDLDTDLGIHAED